MNNTVRFLLAVVGAMVVAALATPELSSKLPPGLAQLLGVAIAAGLHKMDAKSSSETTPDAQ